MSGKSASWGLAAGTKAAKAEAKQRQSEVKRQPQQLPPYNVVLLNDNDHTYEYVIQLLRAVFAYPEEKGFPRPSASMKMSAPIVFTTHKELAELKREQIQSFGTDHRIARCKGSMSAIIEPA